MAKRHHHKMMENKHRHKVMEKKHNEDMYSGHSERRHQEMKDAGMIHEDHAAVANLPQNVMYHDWPGDRRAYLDSYLNDDIVGVNRQMAADEGMARKHLAPHKW